MVTLWFIQNQVQSFKEEMVYDDILRTEANERSMLLWLRNLRIHSFEPRHFENINPMHYDNIRVKASSVENGLKSQEESTKPLPTNNGVIPSVCENLSEIEGSSSREEPTSKRKKI